MRLLFACFLHAYLQIWIKVVLVKTSRTFSLIVLTVNIPEAAKKQTS